MSAGVRLPRLNLVLLSGRVTRDAELFFTSGGAPKLTIPVAVNRSIKDSKTGEWKEETFFINVVAWQELAERSKDRARKGAPIVVEGRLAGREFEDKSGQKRAVLEVVASRVQFLAPSGPDPDAPAKVGAEVGSEGAAGSGDPLEEVPF